MPLFEAATERLRPVSKENRRQINEPIAEDRSDQRDDVPDHRVGKSKAEKAKKGRPIDAVASTTGQSNHISTAQMPR